MNSFQAFIEKPPVVFISYSWSSDEHIEQVLNLARRLRSDGVDVKIDKWDLKEGQDKYDYMELLVKDETVSRVLLLCDRVYSEKANSRKGGVGSEAQIITPELYENAQNEKFIPIIFERDENGKEYVPTFLKSRIYIDFSDERKFEEEYIHLLRVIFNRPENPKTPLGTPPSFIFDETTSPITKTLSKVNQFKQLVLSGKLTAQGAFEDYLENLYSILETEFKIEGTEENKPFDELLIESINKFLPYRDEFIEIVLFIIKYRLDRSYFEQIRDFFTKLLNLFTDHYYSNSSELFDNYRFITWELFLYTTALLINKRKITEFQLFTDSGYFINNQHMKQVESFVVFRQYIRTLEEIRKNRLKSNALSLSVDELRQRCYYNIPFDLLLQADLIFISQK